MDRVRDVSRVAHHGRDTAYHRFDRGGDGPTVCFVHGSGGNAGIWTAQARLRDRFPVVALDLSGHGESDDVATPAGPATLDAYADDVVAVAEATDADVLCGNSLGGAVALWVALERDLALDGLVLAGTGAKLTVGRELLAALATDFDRAVSLVHEPDRLFHDATPRVLERSRATMADCGRAVTERDFLTCHRFDVRDRLGEVSVPTLAVVGERDTLTPPAYHKFLADRIPNGEYAAVDDAAHLAMLETPDGFGSTVAGFLDRLG